MAVLAKSVDRTCVHVRQRSVVPYLMIEFCDLEQREIEPLWVIVTDRSVPGNRRFVAY